MIQPHIAAESGILVAQLADAAWRWPQSRDWRSPFFVLSPPQFACSRGPQCCMRPWRFPCLAGSCRRYPFQCRRCFRVRRCPFRVMPRHQRSMQEAIPAMRPATLSGTSNYSKNLPSKSTLQFRGQRSPFSVSTHRHIRQSRFPGEPPRAWSICLSPSV